MMELKQFRSQFKSIVYAKGRLTDLSTHIRTLSHYDRNDSHKRAILQAIDRRDRFKRDFEILLNGRTYEEWLKLSKRLSILNSRLKNATQRKVTLQSEINQLLNPEP